MQTQKKNFFLKCFKNISSLPLKSMSKSIYEPIYHINVAVIQLQSNLLFQYTIAIEKLYEIVKPIWLTGNAICKQTWLTGSVIPMCLISFKNKKNKTLTF